jgi:hypothetical protein
MIRKVVFTIVLASVASLIAIGQTDGTTPAPAFGPELPYSEPLSPPLPVAGVRAPLRFSSEEPRSNYLTGSVGVSTAYDDNILSSAMNRVGDVSYMLFPTLDIVQSRGRFNWDVGYSPGFTFNQRLNERNQSAHDLHLLLGYRLSPHVNLSVHDGFDKATTLFSDLRASDSLLPGPLQQPNTSLITPLSNQTRNTSGVDLTYQFGRDSLVGASGGYYFVNYGQTPTTTGTTINLIDSQSWQADAFYAHRFASRHWFGLTYNRQRITSDPSYRTDLQRAFLFYSVSFASHMNFSLWAGPENTASRLPVVAFGPGAPLVNRSNWNTAGGATFSWEGVRTGISAGYSRQTSDGGGLTEAARMEAINADIQRKLSQRWTGTLGAVYAFNKSVSSSLFQSARTLSGTAGVDCRVRDSIGLGFRYGRDQQTYAQTTNTSPINRNRAWVTLSYSFTRPLGR